MTIEELDAKMSAEFAAVRAHVDRAFDAAIKADGDSIRAHVDRTIKAEEDSVRAHIDRAIKADRDSFRAHVDARITAEGETTRRHFDIVAEQFKDRTKVLADGIGRNTERLDDHEKRISIIESRRS